MIDVSTAGRVDARDLPGGCISLNAGAVVCDDYVDALIVVPAPHRLQGLVQRGIA